MGGNRKQANRTKNNARPANSGRSAELLGNVPPPFVGFSAVKDGAFVAVLPGFSSNIDDINQNVDPNFQLLLKKMNKKDATTKLKALQEFSELVRGSDVEAVKAILPFWPRLYCQLATDAEHRVREALHQAQRVVVLKAKRNIAPFLKQLAGPWFTSQYDTYAPAATAAKQAFQEAFPPNKLLEAINFCQEEILAYITDNLTIQTAQTLSNPKMTSPEDMEAKHQRVLISSLQGYVLYLRKLPAEQLLAAYETNRKLVGSAKYWKLAKHAAPLVRSAWFSAVIALCQKSPDLVMSESSRFVMGTLGRLDESDPAVLPIVWEAALHVMTTVPDCWSHVNAEKVVLPKLYLLAREGGQGNAGSIFPNLLPFLSKLPESVMTDKQAFYDKFFANMRTGFTQKCVVQSPSESAAVAKCYVECLKYAIVTSQEDHAFCQHVIKNQLMPAVRLVLMDSRLNLFYATHFTQISLLVHQWDRNRGIQLNSKLLEQFWTSIEEVNAHCLVPPPEQSMEPQYRPSVWTLERQVALCLYLRNPSQKRIIQNLRVKFTCEGEMEENKSTSDSTVCPTVDDHSRDLDRELYRFVESICVTYFKLTESENTTCFLNHLSKLVPIFDCKELFMSFLDASNVEDFSTRRSLTDLFTSPLQGWLNNEEMRIEPTINLTFTLLKHLEPSESCIVLDAIGQLCLGPAAVDCLTAALKHRDEDSVARFLRSDVTSGILVALAQGVCVGSGRARDWELLRQCCLSRTPAGDFVISDSAFCNIVSVFEQDMGAASEDSVQPTVSLANVFFTERLNEGTMLTAEDFFLHLLRQSVSTSEFVPAVEAATKVFLKKGRLDPLMHKVATFVRKELEFKRVPSLSLGHEVDVAAAVHRFLAAASSDSPPVEATRHFLAVYSAQLAPLEPVLSYITRDGFQRWRAHVMEDKKGFCECRDLKIMDGLTFDEALNLYLLSLLFQFLLLKKVLMGDNMSISEQTEEEEVEDDEKHQSSCETFQALEDHIVVLTNSLEVCSAFTTRYAGTVYNFKISTVFTAISGTCDELRKWEMFKAAATLARRGKSPVKQGLRLPWNRPINEPVIRPTTEPVGRPVSEPVSMPVSEPVNIAISEPVNVPVSEPVNIPIGVPVSSKGTSSEHVEKAQKEKTPDSVRAVQVSTEEPLTCWMAFLDGFSCDCSDPVDLLDVIFPLDRALFLFECDVTDKSELQVVTMAATARFMANLIANRHEEMKPKQWDFVVIALASWVQSLGKSKHSLLLPSRSFPIHPAAVRDEEQTEPVEVAASRDPRKESPHNHNAAVLTEAVCELFVSFYHHLNTAVPKDEKKLAAHNTMKQEWTDLFEQDTNNVMVDLFIMIAELSRQRELSLLDLPAIEAVALALWSFKVASCTKRDALLDCCLQTTCSPVVALQLAAFHGLHDFVSDLVIKDGETLSKWSETLSKADDPSEAEPSAQLNLRLLLPHLADTQTVVTAMLAGVRVGESCIVAPYTDASTYTLAYLSMWTVVLYMCEEADSALRCQYADILRDEKFLDILLRTVFRLMPDEVLAISYGKSRSRKTLELFSVAPKLDRDQIMTSTVVEHMACWVYWLCLCRLPAEVRMWWSSVDQRYCSLVDRVTTKHVSPVLCEVEMKTVQIHVAKRKTNMTIKVHASVNEVHAVYTVDEARLELAMSLPANYPLGLVSIDTKNTEKIQESGKEGRGWLMQLRMFLSHQNGSLWEGLSLWKSNLDKRFEGVEECFICYSILHGSNFQLPKVACRTCKKKFHSGCMYKWFSTSNKPTCPICRNQF